MKPTADTPLKDFNRAIVLRPLATAGESIRDGEARLLEAVGLAQALGLDVTHAEAPPLRQISPRTYLGGGRVERLKERAEETGAGVIVIDAPLSPVQQRNLETDIGAKVVDRTGLILEIFGLRARTKEGKLQVELARQGYERSRLVRTWTHLERQRGGLGKTGGPGETQIELDRRIIADRILKLKRETGGRAAHARPAAACALACWPAGRGAGRLHERRQIHAVQSADAGWRAGQRHAVRHARSHGAASEAAEPSRSDHERYGGLHLRSAARIGGGVSRHAGGGDGSGFARARARHRASGNGEAEGRRAGVLAQLAKDAGGKTPPVLEAWNKIDLLDDATREGRLRRAQAAAEQGQGAPYPLLRSRRRRGRAWRPCSRRSIARPSRRRA
jgi:GTP-binding protein HflX